MGRRSCMSSPPRKREFRLDTGQRERSCDACEGSGMPADGDIDVVKNTRFYHKAFCRSAFLGRAAEISHPPGQVASGQPFLESRSRKKRGGTQQVMAATVPVASL